MGKVSDGRFHHSPSRRSGKKNRLLGVEQLLQARMNIPVEIFEIFAAVTNHRPRKCGHGFRRYFDRPWGEKFIVRLHQRILIAKCRSANDRSYDSFLIKLTSPLRSSRATLILSRSSVAADNLKSSSRSCFETNFCFIAFQSISPSRTMVTSSPLISLPKRCDRYAAKAQQRWMTIKTTEAKIVIRSGPLPLIARERIDPSSTMKMASNAVFSDRDRRSPTRTRTSPTTKMTRQRNET